MRLNFHEFVLKAGENERNIVSEILNVYVCCSFWILWSQTTFLGKYLKKQISINFVFCGNGPF